MGVGGWVGGWMQEGRGERGGLNAVLDCVGGWVVEKKAV